MSALIFFYTVSSGWFFWVRHLETKLIHLNVQFHKPILCCAQSGFDFMSILHSIYRAANFAVLIVRNGQWACLLLPASLWLMMELFLCTIHKEMAIGIAWFICCAVCIVYMQYVSSRVIILYSQILDSYWILTVQLTVLLEYFDSNCIFYQSSWSQQLRT